MSPTSRSYFVLLFAAVVVVTIAVYWPGLSGTYVLDDFPNIVHNADIHISALTFESLKNAAFSAPNGVFQRPLAMVSFALNWLVSGADPRPMKVINLAIHVLNGLLVYAMLHALLRASAHRRGAVTAAFPNNASLALAISACWLLLPINLTSVLYVVQRMESLCQSFVLAGLWAYLHGRRMMLIATDTKQDQKGLSWAVGGLVCGTALGVLAKESAVLLPVYAFLVEATVLGFQRKDGVNDLRLWFVFLVTLFLPALVGLAWLLPHAMNPATWAQRPFSLSERLLTEPRVLMEYLRWTLLPDSRSLGLYHDDIEISRSLLSPLTTLPAIAGLAGLVAIALASLRRLPLCSLGILWFLGAQSLTATFLPLELVFEHRNYFASIGTLLAAFALLQRICVSIGVPSLIHAVTLTFALYFGFVTRERAQEWSAPLEFVVAEASHHPNSSRATYTAGQVLVAASEYKPSAMLDAGVAYLRHAAALPDGSVLPEQALIVVANRAYQRDAAAEWKALINKLQLHPINVESLEALISLNRCFVEQHCRLGQNMLQNAYETALEHSPVSTLLLNAYGDFARNVLHDDHVAAMLAHEAANLKSQP